MNKQTSKILSLALLLLAFCTGSDAFSQDKTGILMVHYGTNNDARRQSTIDLLNEEVAKQFPQCEVVEAYTAASVIKSLAKRGIHKMTVAAALDTLKARGCTKVAVQSTMLLDGNMTDIIKSESKQADKQFAKLNIGRALLYSVDDCSDMAEMIEKYLTASKGLNLKNSQVVLVGHGSDSPANAIYSQLDYLLQDEGKKNWHVGTIEGYPTLNTVKRRLATQKCKNVILVPLLYIAGNHLRDDVDGEWRTQLEAGGYKVTVVKSGLGEMPEIRRLIVNKINDLITTETNK